MSDLGTFLQQMQDARYATIKSILSPITNYKPDVVQQSFHERDLKSGAQQQLLDIYRNFQLENRNALAFNDPNAMAQLEDIKRQILNFNAKSADVGTKLSAYQTKAATDPAAQALINQYSGVFEEFESPSQVNFQYDSETNRIMVQEKDSEGNDVLVNLTDSQYHSKVDPDQVQTKIDPIADASFQVASSQRFQSIRQNAINQGQEWNMNKNIDAIKSVLENDLKYKSSRMTYDYNVFASSWLQNQTNAPTDPQEQAEFLRENQEAVMTAFVQDINMSTFQAWNPAAATTTNTATPRFTYKSGAFTNFNSVNTATSQSPNASFEFKYKGSTSASQTYQSNFYGASTDATGIGNATISTSSSIYSGYGNINVADDQGNTQTVSRNAITLNDAPPINSSFDVALLNGAPRTGVVEGKLLSISEPVFVYAPIGAQNKEYEWEGGNKVEKGMMMPDNKMLEYLKDYTQNKLGMTETSLLGASSVKGFFDAYINELGLNEQAFYEKDLSRTFGIQSAQVAEVHKGSDVYHIPLYGETKNQFDEIISTVYTDPGAGVSVSGYEQALYVTAPVYVDIFLSQTGAGQMGLGNLPMVNTSSRVPPGTYRMGRN